MQHKFHRQTQLRVMIACAVASWALVSGAAVAAGMAFAAG
jgi:uncharacterized membrane protein